MQPSASFCAHDAAREPKQLSIPDLSSKVLFILIVTLRLLIHLRSLNQCRSSWKVHEKI